MATNRLMGVSRKFAGAVLVAGLVMGISACDSREDQPGLPSPEQTSLPGVTYSGGPTPTGDASGE